MWLQVKVSDAEMVTTRRASWPGPCGSPANQYADEYSEQACFDHLDDTSAQPSRYRCRTLADAISDLE